MNNSPVVAATSEQVAALTEHGFRVDGVWPAFRNQPARLAVTDCHPKSPAFKASTSIPHFANAEQIRAHIFALRQKFMVADAEREPAAEEFAEVGMTQPAPFLE